MVAQPPPPPSITPRQMNLLRVVLALAWSDGNLAKEEASLMITRFSQIFAATSARRHYLEQELQSYLVQDIPLEELVPKLQSSVEKEFALRLGYEVISASALSPGEDAINQDESQAYQKLVTLLGLAPDVVTRIEAEAQTALQTQDSNVIDLLVYQLRDYLQS